MRVNSYFVHTVHNLLGVLWPLGFRVTLRKKLSFQYELKSLLCAALLLNLPGKSIGNCKLISISILTDFDLAIAPFETIAIEMFRIMIGSFLIVLFKGNARLLVPKCRTENLVNFLIGFSRSTDALPNDYNEDRK